MLIPWRVSSWGHIFWDECKLFEVPRKSCAEGACVSMDIEINKGFYYVHNCVCNIVYVKNNVLFLLI